jgi:hypothetical protein
MIAIAIPARAEIAATTGAGIAGMTDVSIEDMDSIAESGNTEMVDSGPGDVTIRTRIQIQTTITGTRDEAEVREM